MKRYYVCKVIGDGSYESPYRAAIADVVDPSTHLLAFTIAATIKSNPDGTPALPWCLVIAAGKNHALVNSNADIDPLPDYPLDVKLSAMNTATKLAAFNKMAARGINTNALSNADGYRDLIRGLGQQHEASFSEDNFDAPE